MAKRKRGEDGNANSIPLGTPKTKSQRHTSLVEAKLEFGVKELLKALKVAAGFERQKFSRRKKEAQKKDEKTRDRVEAEWNFLKVSYHGKCLTTSANVFLNLEALDYEAVAEHHLHKTLLKIKAVSSSPVIPPALTRLRPLTTDPAGLNVLARLYKAAPVHKTLIQTVEDIVRVLASASSADPTKERTQDIESASASGSDDGSMDIEGMADELGGSDSEDENSGSWDGFEDSEGEELDKLRRKNADAKQEPDRRELSISLSPEPNRGPENGHTRQVANKSTFIPALTMGGYWSGSESEPEDELDVAPKRNRRGQRARQQIWEKKFGGKAKHLQKPEKDERNKDWDPKRGARSVDERHNKKRQVDGARRRPQNGLTDQRRDVTDAETSARKVGRRDDTGSLHPSWEAAKRAKETKQNIQFAGKKITFE